MHRIVRVDVLSDYRLDLLFEDGTHGLVDLSHLVGSGVFTAWKDYSIFQGVKIGDGGELIWSDSVDLCADSLYLRVTGKSPEEIFPSLKHEPIHA
jgi:hypothetical protein